MNEIITEARSNSLILVDFQPAYDSGRWGYREAIARSMEYINKNKPQVTAFYNGAEGGEVDTLYDVAWHYVEYGLKEENLDLIKFKENGWTPTRSTGKHLLIRV